MYASSLGAATNESSLVGKRFRYFETEMTYFEIDSYINVHILVRTKAAKLYTHESILIYE